MRKLLIILLLSLAACQRSVPTIDSHLGQLEDEIGLRQEEQIYEVLTIDSLASIARRHGVTPQAIIELNRLKRPYILKPGQLLKIPSNNPAHQATQEASRNSVHTVKIAPRGLL